MRNYTTLFLSVIWLFFVAGLFFSLLLRAYAVVQSTLNGIHTYEDFFRRQGIPILCRLFISIVILQYWLYHPDVLNVAVLAWIPDRYHDLLGLHPLSLNPATVAILGFNIDTLLDKGSILLSRLPGFHWLHVEVAPGPVAKPGGDPDASGTAPLRVERDRNGDDW